MDSSKKKLQIILGRLGIQVAESEQLEEISTSVVKYVLVSELLRYKDAS